VTFRRMRSEVCFPPNADIGVSGCGCGVSVRYGLKADIRGRA
jgi:hypothetical protein